MDVTIQTIFQIAMLTIYSDRENIKNVDDIQKIFNEKYIKKINDKKEVDILKIIKEIKDNIQVTDLLYKTLLEFIGDLFNLVCNEEMDLSSSKSIKRIEDKEIGDETKEIIDIIPDKKEYKEEESFNEDISKSLVVPDFSITKIFPEKRKKIIMDDIFFVNDAN